MKMLFMNPKRKSTVKGETMFKRRKSVTAHKAKRRVKRRNPRAVATVAASAPKRRTLRRRASTGVRVATRRLKRRVGGFGGAKSMIPAAKQTIMQGAIAGIGAIGADIVAAQLMKYVPASFKTAQMQPFAQVAVSLLAGIVISKVNKKAGDAVAIGGVTVATYNLGKSLLKTSGIPGLSGYNDLQGYDYDPAYGVGSYDRGLRSVTDNNPLAEYTNGGMFPNNAGDGIGMYDQNFGVN